MDRLLIFGGTTEGRRLSEYCARHRIYADVSVTTEYGAGLLPCSEYIRALPGEKPEREIGDMLACGGYSMVVDATHPYARRISATLRRVCGRQEIRYIRVLRESVSVEGTTVESLDELISYINKRRADDRELRILSMLGGKSLAKLAEAEGYREYVYVRALPSEGVLEDARRLGFPKEHIIAAKGPFSVEQNVAHIRMCGAGLLATKESGAAGGYPEKVRAAEATGAELVTIVRPYEDGISYDEAVSIIEGTVRGVK